MKRTISDHRAVRRIIGQFHPDWFVLSLAGTVVAASLVPSRGATAQVFSALGMLAIGALFFLQGARMSRAAITAGMTHWRLHLSIARLPCRVPRSRRAC